MSLSWWVLCPKVFFFPGGCICMSISPLASIWHGAVVPHTQTPLLGLALFVDVYADVVLYCGCPGLFVALWSCSYVVCKACWVGEGATWMAWPVGSCCWLLTASVSAWRTFLFVFLWVCFRSLSYLPFLITSTTITSIIATSGIFVNGCVDSQPLFASFRQRR